jgi:hypothetical protein
MAAGLLPGQGKQVWTSIRAPMKSRLARTLELLLACTLGWSQPGQPASDYARLRDQLKGGDLSVSFKQLRLSYVASPEYQKRQDTDEQHKQMMSALNARDFKSAVNNAETVLANDYCDIDAHFTEYISYRELGDSTQADFHHRAFRGLVQSILDSGDGKSTKTAYVVISVHEEYVILRVLGLTPGKQSLLKEGSHSFDFLEANDAESGKTVELFFNVDIPMAILDQALGIKK